MPGGGHHAQGQRVLHAAEGLVVHVAVDGEIACGVAHLDEAFEDVGEDGVGHLPLHLGGLHLLMVDLAGDFLFFVGQEGVDLAVARDVILALKAVERTLHALAQRLHVNVHAVGHHDGHVGEVGLEVAHIAHEEEELEHLDILGHEALVALGGLLGAAVDDAADVALEEGAECVVEAPERHEGVLVAGRNGLSRLLETREHGALAAGEVLAGAAAGA